MVIRSLLLAFLLFPSLTFGQQNWRPGEVLVRLEKGARFSDVQRALLAKVPATANLNEARPLGKSEVYHKINLQGSGLEDKALEQLVARLPGVEATSLNYLVQYLAMPNDAMYGQQWGMQDTHVEEVWDFTTGGAMANGKRIAVGISDQAINTNHPDLVGNIWPGSPHQGPGEGDGHGTKVASVVGAVGNNSIGFAGVNWDVDIISAEDGDMEDLASSIDAFLHALELRQDFNTSNGTQGAMVVSITVSWVTLAVDPCNFGNSLFDELADEGVVVVTTGDNDPGLDLDVAPMFPSSCAQAEHLVVTSYDPVGAIPFSYGDSTVHFLSPGVQIPVANNQGGYEISQGNSFAIPYAAGAIALLYSMPCPQFAELVMNNPRAARDAVRSALINNTTPVAGADTMCITGGKMNVFAAYQALMAQCSSFCQEYTVSFQSASAAAAAYTLQGSGNEYNAIEGSGSSLAACLADGCYSAHFYDANGNSLEGTWTVLDASSAVVATGSTDLELGENVLRFSLGTIVSGCMSPNADNYDPAANCDDGSCCNTLVNITLSDSGGDGWEGATYALTNGLGATLLSGTLASGGDSTLAFCAPHGCHTFTVTNGADPSEIEWSITGDAQGSGLAGSTFSFSIGPVLGGCTDPLANNYNASANCPDGSCCYGATAPVIFTENITPGVLEWLVTTAQGDTVVTSELPEPALACIATECGLLLSVTDTLINGSGGFVRVIEMLTSEVTDVPVVDGGSATAPLFIGVTGGCTNPAAANYQPTATCDDGTCCTTEYATLRVLANDQGVQDEPFLYTITSALGTVQGTAILDPMDGSSMAEIGVCLDTGCVTITLQPVNVALYEQAMLTYSNNEAVLFPTMTGLQTAFGFPFGLEFCDGFDNDCDGQVDEEEVFADMDDDGFGDNNNIVTCGTPGATPVGGDCDDTNAFVFPQAQEVCDGTDNDCDGLTDEVPLFADADSDGFGDPNAILPCDDPLGVDDPSDCDDTNPAIHPGAVEITADGIDNDCNGEVDQNDSDMDGDGFTVNQGDCDDSNADVSPGALEVLNGIDDDCDGQVDEGTGDSDGDGQTQQDGDCDDNDPLVFAGAPEICDGADNDCDGIVDNGFQWYTDADGDGFGDDASEQLSCTPVAGAVQQGGDCNDADPALHVLATLTLLSANEDEFGMAHYVITNGTNNLESDLELTEENFGAGEFNFCATTTCVTVTISEVDVQLSSTSYLTVDGATVEFNTAAGYQGFIGDGTEICDGLDNDCNGVVDDGLPQQYADNDGDGYGDTSVIMPCDTPGVAVNGDCDDSNPSVFPGSGCASCTPQDMAWFTNDGQPQQFCIAECFGGTLEETIECLVGCYVDAGLGTPCATCVVEYQVCMATSCAVCAVDPNSSACLQCRQQSGCDSAYMACSGLQDNDSDGFFNLEDCDDGNPNIHPNAAEGCIVDGLDNDCDGQVDEDALVDQDADGFTRCAGDCNDLNEEVNPDATETCDGVDNDCNAIVDEGFPAHYADNDGDGYGDPLTPLSCGSGVTNTLDCDDQDANVNPTATDLCDGIDNDCNGTVDDNPADDADNDGFSLCAGDCDDQDATVFPGAPELCDGIDNDCNGTFEPQLHADLDGDGYGDATNPVACGQAGVPNAQDCDDTDPLITLPYGWFVDADGDGYGTSGTAVLACTQPMGRVANSYDCDDTNANIFPGQGCLECLPADLSLLASDPYIVSPTQACLQDCADASDPQQCIAGCYVDNGLSPTCADCFAAYQFCLVAQCPVCQEYPESQACIQCLANSDCAAGFEACSGLDDTDGDGYFAPYDCDDTNTTVHPDAPELCDGLDNDCDGGADEGVASMWYYDGDGDAFGIPETTMVACTQPLGFALLDGDCDDQNPLTFPGANEICDGNDNDCDGAVDEHGSVDQDGDGYTLCGGDCNDQDAGMNPGVAELCDGIDNNCNGSVDESDDPDGDGLSNCMDDCPYLPGVIGSPCVLNDDPLAPMGIINETCTCIVACTENIVVDLRTDLNSQQASFTIREISTSGILCQGSGFFPGVNTPIIVDCCLPEGCFKLEVFDSGGDGFVTGGYQVRESGAAGRRIIDNFGNFSAGSVSATLDPSSFCLPIGDDQLIFSNRDKLTWVNGQYLVAIANAAVNAEWVPGGANSVQDGNSGYEFWIFDPNGSYSYRRFRSHNVSDGFSPANSFRACHMKLNGWTNGALTPHVPIGTLMNVRIRGRVNGTDLSHFGPACTLRIDPIAAMCPPIWLQDDPSNPSDFSCGVIRNWGGPNGAANKIVAKPPQFMPTNIPGPVRYQFRFRIPGEGVCITRPPQSSPTLYLNWNAGTPLQCSKTYEVDVRASKDGGVTWCTAQQTTTCDGSATSWGRQCFVTINPCETSQAMMVSQTDNEAIVMMVFPNPNNGLRVHFAMDAITEAHDASVEFTAINGATVLVTQQHLAAGSNRFAVDLNGALRPGTYIVRVTLANNTFVQRLFVSE